MCNDAKYKLISLESRPVEICLKTRGISDFDLCYMIIAEKHQVCGFV